MRTTSLIALFTLASAVVGTNTTEFTEFYTLGCPNSTKPHASQDEQLVAVNDFANLLYLQKAIETAEYKYVAKDFINHAPEVPGNGIALAIQTLSKLLPTSTIEIQRIFVGKDINGKSFSTTHFKGISSVQGVGDIADIWRLIGTCKYLVLVLRIFEACLPLRPLY